jgi:hypothetical protein
LRSLFASRRFRARIPVLLTHAKSSMPSQMPPLLSPLAAHHQSGGSSGSPRGSPGAQQAFPPFPTQGFVGGGNPAQQQQQRPYYAGPSWQTQPYAPQQYQGKQSGAPTMHGPLQQAYAAESSSPFQMLPPYHAVTFPPPWSTGTNTSQWMSSPSPQPGAHWLQPSPASRPASHAQLSALVPPSSSSAAMSFHHSPRGEAGAPFSMVPHSNGGMEPGLQMPFQEMSFGRGAGGGSAAPYPSATMVITPKTDGLSSLCDPLQVILLLSSLISPNIHDSPLPRVYRISPISVRFIADRRDYHYLFFSFSNTFSRMRGDGSLFFPSSCIDYIIFQSGSVHAGYQSVIPETRHDLIQCPRVQF